MLIGAALILAAPAAFASPGRAPLSGLDLTKAYVLARAASAEGASDAAVAGYAQALAAAPTDPVVAVRAYREALSVGDLPLARQTVAVLLKADGAPGDVPLFAFADAVNARNAAAADAAVAKVGRSSLDFMAPVLRAWLGFERGQPQPLAPLDNQANGSLARRYAAEHRPLLLIASGHVDEGMAALRAILGTELGDPALRVDAARLLIARGRKDLAASVVPDGPDALRMLGKGVKPGAAFGASRLFTRVASDLAREQEPQPISVALTRIALMLDPGNDEARLLLADVLSKLGNNDRAIAELKLLPPQSPMARRGETALAQVLERAGRHDEALAHAQALAARADASVEEIQAYADLLMTSKRFADAASAYRSALAKADPQSAWLMNLQLGGALDRSGDWAAAQPYLRKAVELAPEEAAALNYLGYGLAERGQDLSEARALLERARKLQPNSAAITDSLAWAYYRSGDVKGALPLLEQAAAAEPADSAINEHLGDVYWSIGRRYEARYAWRAAATLADDKDAARIKSKIDQGLAGS